MTSAQLAAFVAVAELQSFTAAAFRLGITQSGVSHAIRALELELGVNLFHRQKAEIQLTEIGSQLLQRAREMLGISETMLQEAADARGLKKGTLHIGSFGPSSSLRLLPKMLENFRRHYPGIEVHVAEGPDEEVLLWLQDRHIDLGFVVLPEERYATTPVAEDQLVVVLPLQHPLAEHKALRLDALCTDPFIMTEAGSARIIGRLFEAARLNPKIRYHSTQILSTLGMVANGQGIAIVAELALPEKPLGNYIVKPLAPQIRRKIGIAIHSTRLASPAALAFINMVRKSYSL